MQVLSLKQYKGTAVWGAIVVLVATMAVQTFHSFEHILQVIQRYQLGMASANGLLGDLVSSEWVHFLYNGGLWIGLCLVVLIAGKAGRAQWRSERPGALKLLYVAVAAQSYHFLEHVARFYEFIATGNPYPGGLVGSYFEPIMFHSILNTIVWAFMLAAFAGLLRNRAASPRFATV